MVLGLRSKTKKGASVRAVYTIVIQEIKPWPPSQSLKTVRSVVLQWENGDRNSGTTKIVSPSLGSSPADGKIDFNESFKLEVILSKEGAAKKNDKGAFQKNILEFNLYEPRRDKSKGQQLGSAMIDLGEYGLIEETVTVSVPVNSKRNIRNMAQPMLYVNIQPSEKDSTSSSSKGGLLKEVSSDKEGKESVSALMNEEYAEEAEFDSFTDDDVSSHSSLPNTSSTLEVNVDLAVTSSPDAQKRYKKVSEVIKENDRISNGGSSLSLDSASAEVLSESSMLTEEKPDTFSTFSLSSSNHEEEIISTETEDPAVQDVQDKMVDCSDEQTVIEVTLPENSNRNKYINQYSDIEFQPQERRKGLEEVANICNINHMITGKQVPISSIETGPSSQPERTENQLANAHGNMEILENPSVASAASAENAPETQKKSFQLHRGTQSFDLTLSSQESIAESGSRSFASERLKNLRFSVRSPTHVKGLIRNGASDLYTDVKEIDMQEDKGASATNSETDGVDEKKSISPNSGKIRHASRTRRNGFLNNKIQELELRINSLEGELREAAAIEIGLYSIVAEHGNSTHKLHTPARRLSRLYLHASKQLSVERRSGAARSVVSGLALAAKACGNDVPRLTFWLSNTIILRAIILETHTRPDSAKNGSPYFAVNGSRGVAKSMSSSLKWESVSQENEKFSFPEELENWEDPETFIYALGKIETWLFQRTIESLWWQTFTTYMQCQQELGDGKIGASSKKSYGRTRTVSDQQKSISSISIWKRAFKGAFEKICPVRAGGHECGCLFMLARLIMEQCVSRLDVAMFNAILRESDDEIPTDPLSDPISDTEVLPINYGEFSFGAGARLKNSIGNWSRLLTDLFGMDMDDSDRYEDDEVDNNVTDAVPFKSFRLLNALSSLLMLPKDMLLEKSVRTEVCPIFSSSVIKQILEKFAPDEFCPDPIPITVLEALENEELLESSKEEIIHIPCSASPIIYSAPSVASIENILGEVQITSHLRRSGSSLTRKSQKSDDELDELNSPLDAFIIDKSSTFMPETKDSSCPSAVRYQLLREVWRDDER